MKRRIVFIGVYGFGENSGRAFTMEFSLLSHKEHAYEESLALFP